MPANTSPIFTLTPNANGVACGGTANAKSDGAGTIGTDIFKVLTAGSNGSFVYSVRLSPFASVAATATSATTIRVFLSTATSGATTSANTWLLAEISAASQTADHSTTATTGFDIPLNRAIPAGYTILVTCHVINAANTGWMAVGFAGDY